MSDEVVCEREFNMVIDGQTTPFHVRWMKPAPDRTAWRCDYTIAWPDRPMRRRSAIGVDSTQALLLAIKVAAAELYDAEPQVFWWDPDDVLDLPILDGVADLEAARTKGRG